MSTLTKDGKDADVKAKRGRAAAAESGLLAGGRRALAGQQRPRNRSWGLVIVAALLVVGTGLAVAAWGLHAGQRESVLAISSPIAKGQVVERKDLVSTSVSGVNGAVPVGEVGSIVGKTAAVDLVSGQILTNQMVTSGAVPAQGQSTVGLALDPTRAPGAGLDPGDVVTVIAVPGGDNAPRSGSDEIDNPTVLASNAGVYAVGGQQTSGGQQLVTLVVPAKDAARIAAYSTQNRIALVETAPGSGGGS